ncbi:MAG: cysteine desulfurase [Patescibacteria group bacterium]|nr:cysteine desulfurase [Patescibacteria group bacterium]
MSTKKSFPLLANNPDTIYLDSAATSQKPQSVLNAELEHYLNCNAPTGRSLYPMANAATEALNQAREEIARFIGAENTASVVFTSGTTMSTNTVAFAWARKNLKAGDKILTTIMEHHANIVPWQILSEDIGTILDFVHLDNNALLDLTEMENKLSVGDVKLVCVGHVSSVTATLNPVKKIIALAKKYGAKILVDGAQSTGHIPIDVNDLNPDFYACSGHKMLGPMGTGILFVHPDRFNEIGTMFTGGDMISKVTPTEPWFKPLPTKLEAGTQNVSGFIGLAEAARWLNNYPDGLIGVERYIKSLGTYAWQELAQIPNILLLGPGPGDSCSSSLVSFTFNHPACPNRKKIDDMILGEKLGEQNICVRSGIFCTEPLFSHQLNLKGATRASFHIYNTKEDIDQLVQAIQKIIN